MGVVATTLVRDARSNSVVGLATSSAAFIGKPAEGFDRNQPSLDRNRDRSCRKSALGNGFFQNRESGGKDAILILGCVE